MTEERIMKGEELLKKLNCLKEQKRRWEMAKGFYRLEVETDRGGALNINGSFINFSEVKLLTIAKIDRRINEVQKEFDEL